MINDCYTMRQNGHSSCEFGWILKLHRSSWSDTIDILIDTNNFAVNTNF